MVTPLDFVHRLESTDTAGPEKLSIFMYSGDVSTIRLARNLCGD